MKKVYTATEARTNLFKILDAVAHDNQVIYITKNKSGKTIKLEQVETDSMHLSDLAGSLEPKDADIMLDVVKNRRKYRTRKVPEL